MDRRSFLSSGAASTAIAAIGAAASAVSSETGGDPAIIALANNLAGDADYAWSWHCNLAATSMGEGLSAAAANRAAASFMSLAFAVRTNLDSRFAPTQSLETERVLPIREELKPGAVVRHRDGRIMIVESVLAQQDSLVRCLLSCPGGEHPNSDGVTFSRPALAAADLTVVGPDSPVLHHGLSVNIESTR